MQISEAAGGVPAPAIGAEPCRFPKLEECAHFHYERVQLPQMSVTLQTSMDQSLHSQHTNEDDGTDWHMVQVTSGDACWLVQRSYENFKMLDAQLHQCIYDRKISQLPDLSSQTFEEIDVEELLIAYLQRLCSIVDNSLNCGPILNWLQMDNKGHRLLVPSEESRSINTPAVAAAYSVRRYVSQARDELNLEVGDMISVIDMASPGESIWWRGKRGFQVGFFPQHCVHIIGDKVPRNMPLPPPVVGRRLKQSGILKERVFGCDLGEHLLNSGHDIPMVLKCCAEFIESHGIVDGIYRLSGVTSNIQKLRNAFDEDRIPNLYTEDILQDIHSVASLLKMYFRELPNPLCTYQLYQSFVNAVQGCSTSTRSSENDHERLLKMREAVQKLPPPHYRTLEYLMRHLARVAKHGANTGMTTRNVAIVWAPNLLRCAELEVGGVAALQGVGVQAVVTEFLICYTDLIFCDHLPNLDHPSLNSESVLSPKRCRPKSLAISTPTKLITLEEARSKHMLNRADECNYIEVGGGPGSLPKKYHTVIELPAGSRKRGLAKRSPLGWRSFFSKARHSSQGSLTKARKASTPSIVIADKSVTESDLTDMKRKLRSVKSAESLTSGHSEPASTELDALGPLHSLHKPPGHNRSVSHDSYFDTLQNSQNNSEGSLLDLSEIQLNFELEESEMRIFSEDESLVSSPRVPRETGQRKILTRSRPDEFSISATNSANPSPKKQARVILSPESMSRKRTRLEDQLSDIQYIDCNTPDNMYTISTTAVIHTLPEPQRTPDIQSFDLYQPKNKSPRNSEVENKRQSLNLEPTPKPRIPKSLTDTKLLILNSSSAFGTPTPQSPVYRPLGDSSSTSTPDFSPSTEIGYQKLKKNNFEDFVTKDGQKLGYENVVSPVTKKPVSPVTPTYENVLTTISIVYKSPTRTTPELSKRNSESVYEDVILNPEKAMVPTLPASLPVQQASQPDVTRIVIGGDKDVFLAPHNAEENRPKSLGALEDLNRPKYTSAKPNVSTEALYDATEVDHKAEEKSNNLTDSTTNSFTSEKNLSSEPLSDFNSDVSPTTCYKSDERLNATDLTLSEVVNSSTEENLSASVSTPLSPTLSPNVSPTCTFDSDVNRTKNTSQNSLLDDSTSRMSSTDDVRPFEVKCKQDTNLIEFSPEECENVDALRVSVNEKRKSSETESLDDSAIYQQVKYFRRSVHEINALLDLGSESKVVNEEQTCAPMDVTDDKSVKSEEDVQNNDAYDSLESENHVYENVDEASTTSEKDYENVKQSDEEADVPHLERNEDTFPVRKNSVRSLTSLFEVKEAVSSYEKKMEDESPSTEAVANNLQAANDVTVDGLYADSESKQDCCKIEEPLEARKEYIRSTSLESETNAKPKKVYDKDSLPPCLRARNLKNQIKTRSLDEEEFKKEFGLHTRRQSVDESLGGTKMNTLPKVLNQPKELPMDNGKVESIHLAHSTENVSTNVSEQLRRDRIEKYKEERRKFLQDKYRSESFKEDKDVLLSRLKIFKNKEEKVAAESGVGECNSRLEDLSIKSRVPRPGGRRKSSKSDETESTNDASSSDVTTDSLDEENVIKSKTTPLERQSTCDRIKDQADNNKTDTRSQRESPVLPDNFRESFRSKTAMFESQANQRRSSEHTKKSVEPRVIEANAYGRKNVKDSIDRILDTEDFIRNRRRDDDCLKNERRRHTYESRERESETERIRRISLESRSPRKENNSPPYCIRDMKAIFESKSKQ